MRRKISVVGLLAVLLALCPAAFAQQAPPPDVRTPQAAAGGAGLLYLDWLDKPTAPKGQIPLLWDAVTAMQTITAKLPGDEDAIAAMQTGKADAVATLTSITALTTAINDLNQKLSALQQRVDSLQPPSNIKDLEFSKAVAGQPISGLWEGVTIAPGFWICAAVPGQPNALAPAADGQPGRTIVFPQKVTLTSITFLTTNARTTGITLTPDNATVGIPVFAQDSTGAAVVGSPVTITATNLPAGLSGTTFKISGAGAASVAPDLRILDLKYQ